MTFTNKAANEMKENILEELYKLSNDPDKSNQTEHLLTMPEFNGSKEQLKEKAKIVLQNILLSFHDFSLTTIDSFFQRIIRAFFRDLGLASNFDVELNSEQVASNALDDYLKKMDENDPLIDIIGNIQDELIRNEKSPDYKKQLLNLSKELFKEHNLPDTRKNRRKLNEIKSELKKYIDTSNQRTDLLKDQINQVIELYDLDPFDFKGKTRSFIYSIIIREKEDIYSLVDLKSWPEAISNPNSWMVATSKGDVKEKILASAKQLLPLFQELNNHIETTKETYFSNLALLKNFNSFEALSYLKAIIEDYINENNLFLLGKTYELLREFLSKTDSPLIYERIGNRYNNIFVDEFQDTSRYQYDNMKPLVSETLASGKDNLIVGDIKQAIYRFRNGDWKLLKYDVQNDFQEIINDLLDYNHRSDLHIVDFNNDLFEKLPIWINQNLHNKVEASFPMWKELKESTAIEEIYSGVKQKYPSYKEKSKGYVQMEFYSNAKTNDEFEEVLFHRMEKELLELEKQGFQAGHIAMLTRKGDEVRKLIQWLSEMQKKHPESQIFEFFSEEVLAIGDSPLVELIICLMKFALLGEGHSKYRQLLMLQMNYFSHKAGLESHFSQNHEGLFIKTGSKLPETLKEVINVGSRSGLLGLFSSIVKELDLGRNTLKEQFYYLAAFSDEIENYHSNCGNDLAGFLKYWKEEGREKNVEPPSSPNKISLMTIHKSKGLAFDVVFMPFSAVDLMPKSKNIIWVKDERFTGEDGKVLEFPIRTEKNTADTRFKTDYWLEVMYNWLDQLNVFYVGCTRPRHALFIYNYEKKIVKNQEAMLMSYLRKFAETSLKKIGSDTNEHEEIEVFVKEENVRKELIPPKKMLKVEKSLTFEEYTSSDKLPKIKAIGPDGGLTSAGFSERTAVEEGLLMHRILELVVRKSDLKKALLQLIEEGHIADSEFDLWENRIQAALKLQPVAEWFRDDLEVLNERDILMPDGRRYRPDRVVLEGPKAILIDYKTGRPYAHYQKQMDTYSTILRDMGYSEIEAWLFYTDAMKTQQII